MIRDFQAGKKKSQDTGLGLALLSLLLGNVFMNAPALNYAAIALLFLAMAVPAVFAPLAPVWFGLSGLLGLAISRLILSIIFFAIVTPVGLIVNFRKDPLELKGFKKSSGMVFITRNHTFTKKDMEDPY